MRQQQHPEQQQLQYHSHMTALHSWFQQRRTRASRRSMPLRLLKKRANCSSSSVENLHAQQRGNASSLLH
jgi:hypothetical protein